MSARVVTSPADLRSGCDAVRARGGRIGFVPTMGALHAGHLELVAEARRRADVVAVSIFVNETQFGPSDDFARYPRDLEGDMRKLESVGTDLVFAPEASALYAAGDQTRVRVGALAEPLEGAHRPGHFEGVATVVVKLLSVVGGCVAVFGRKDYQQLLIVRRVVRDLLLPAHVVGHAIVREADGLAMSSRNAYLSADERARALSIVRGLDAAARRFAAGERRVGALERAARERLEATADSIDYVAVRDPDELHPIAGDVGPRALLAVACRFGRTRLIDNLVLGEDAPPLALAGPPQPG